VFYMKRIELALGLLPPSIDSARTVAAPATPPAAPDSLSQLAVTPQGEPADSSSLPAVSGPAARSTPPKPTDTPNGAKPGSTSTAGAQSASVTTAAGLTATQPQPAAHNDSAVVTRSLLRHPWLRANGDSGAARAVDEGIAPDVLRQYQMEELQGHLALMRRFAARGDVMHAREAYRDASDESRGLELTDRTLSQRLTLLLSVSQRDAMQACQSAHADTLNPFRNQVDCGTLFAW
jgi:hypothetical protein